MTIDKAIEILEDILECGEYEGDPYDSVAVKLGIEALKEVKKVRYGDPALDGELLLGETEE